MCLVSLLTWLQSRLQNARPDERCVVQSYSVDELSVELSIRMVLVVFYMQVGLPGGLGLSWPHLLGEEREGKGTLGSCVVSEGTNAFAVMDWGGGLMLVSG